MVKFMSSDDHIVKLYDLYSKGVTITYTLPQTMNIVQARTVLDKLEVDYFIHDRTLIVDDKFDFDVFIEQYSSLSPI